MSAVAPPPVNSTNSTSSPAIIWAPLPPLLPLPPPPSGNLPTATLIGLVVGVGLGGIFVLIGLGIFFVMKKRKRSWEYFYGESPLGDKDSSYAGPPKRFTGLPKATIPRVASKPSLSPSFVPTPAAALSMNSHLGSVKPLSSPSRISMGHSHGSFTYEELAMATDGFSNSNLLGQGGFGYVHKGVLPNGKVVAIKQLKEGSVQGEREFQAEVEIIGRVHHRHLVSLIGYSIAGDQRMLVYEFVPNSTLEFHLLGKGRPTMNWSTRMKIALGSAKGMAYLHEDCHPKIIHRDIKSSNILLDFDFEAKVSDFGLAKFYLDTDTHISTRVMGTFGYLAPEYAASGKLTEKSDVFSFGVVLLILITGRRPIDTTHSFIDDSMVDWARPLITQALETGKLDGLVDAKLKKDYDLDEMTRVVACAAACVRHSARLRPRMGQIVRALEGNMSLDHLHHEIIPGYSTVYSPGSSNDDTNQYKDDPKKPKRMAALESQEQASCEFQQPSSDMELGR